MTDVRERQLHEVARLSIAHGKVGLHNPLATDGERQAWAARQAEHLRPLTKPHTADCGDERLTISLAIGTNNRDLLRVRVVPQLFGGLGLAATKAVVAADAAIIRDTKNIWDAYLKVSGLLRTLKAPDGELWQDGGHDGCGAGAAVESSVAEEIEPSFVLAATGLFVPDNGTNAGLLAKNQANMQARLDAGFYGGWEPQNHKDYLISVASQNYSYLLVDPQDHETHGHKGNGLLVVTEEDLGYQKTGEALAVTQPTMRTLAHQLGGSSEEIQRIFLGFAEDTVRVGAGLLAPDFPVFA
jgi:hypothetical protein